MAWRAISFFIGSGLMITACSMHGTIFAFLDAASLIIVVLGGFFFAAMGHGPSALGRALLDGIAGQNHPPERRASSAHALNTLRRTIWGAGGAGIVIGSVKILANLDDPSKIGPAAAVALLTPFYAVVIAELFITPLRSALLQEPS